MSSGVTLRLLEEVVDMVAFGICVCVCVCYVQCERSKAGFCVCSLEVYRVTAHREKGSKRRCCSKRLISHSYLISDQLRCRSPLPSVSSTGWRFGNARE